MRLLPAFTGSGVSILTIDRSADVATVVVSVSDSLPGLGSAVVDVAVAVLDRTVPPAVEGLTLTTRVKTAFPTASDGLAQEMVPVPPTAGVVHDQPATAESDTKVVPAGSVSLHATVAAASGPLLVTVIVYVRFVPAVTGSGESVLVTARSAIANSPTMTGSWSDARYGEAGWNTTRGGTSAEPSGFSSNACSAAPSSISSL